MARFHAHDASSQDQANSPGVSHVSPRAVALSQCYRLRVQEGPRGRSKGRGIPCPNSHPDINKTETRRIRRKGPGSPWGSPTFIAATQSQNIEIEVFVVSYLLSLPRLP